MSGPLRVAATFAHAKKGKPKKTVDPTTYELIKGVVAPRQEFAPEEIVARCMVPLVNEVARCLEEKIVALMQTGDIPSALKLRAKYPAGAPATLTTQVSISGRARYAVQVS